MTMANTNPATKEIPITSINGISTAGPITQCTGTIVRFCETNTINTNVMISRKTIRMHYACAPLSAASRAAKKEWIRVIAVS